MDVAANNLATLLVNIYQGEQHVQRARQLVSRFENSSSPLFLDTLGWVQYHSGETEKAISVLEKVVELAPYMPISRYHLGMAYYKVGNKDAARKYLEEALEPRLPFMGAEQAKQVLDGLN
jgi:tetratricopeptide (TPR) repeat protein